MIAPNFDREQPVKAQACCAIALAVALAGCASQPPEPAYTGPAATLEDTGYVNESGHAVLFAATQLGDKPIDNAVDATARASAGMGFNVVPSLPLRIVPARPTTVQLSAMRRAGAPIQELLTSSANKALKPVRGSVAFTPEAGRYYAVTGALTAANSCVWIADAVTMQAATERVCTCQDAARCGPPLAASTSTRRVALAALDAMPASQANVVILNNLPYGWWSDDRSLRVTISLPGREPVELKPGEFVALALPAGTHEATLKHTSMFTYTSKHAITAGEQRRFFGVAMTALSNKLEPITTPLDVDSLPPNLRPHAASAH